MNRRGFLASVATIVAIRPTAKQSAEFTWHGCGWREENGRLTYYTEPHDAKLLSFYNLTAQDPSINRVELLRDLFDKAGIL